MNKDTDVIQAVLKLSRAMRRCAPPPMPGTPPRPGVPGNPPAPPPVNGSISRLLICIAKNPHISSRDLCEILDLRPSSLSEMLSRAESEGYITRVVDEEDRRMQHVDLSPKGQAYFDEMEAAYKEDVKKKSDCFTEEEKELFCSLCRRLTAHLESLAEDIPEPPPGPERPPRRPLPPGGKMRC